MTESFKAMEGNGLKVLETEAWEYGNKKQTVYDRQNSVNEIKEKSDQSPCQESSEKCHDLKLTITGKTPTYSRQPSECPLVEKDSTKKHSTVVNVGDYCSKDSGLSYAETDKERNDTRQYCCILTQGFSFLITFLALGLVLFLYYKLSRDGVAARPIPEVIVGQSYHEPADRISGSFKLDQHYLSAHKRIRWTEDKFSEIKPNSEEPCLIMPVTGKYQVFSRFTFILPPGDTKTMFIHMLTQRSKTDSGEMQGSVFRRQYVSVIEHKLKEDSELRKPSVFIQFFDLKAGDEICTIVSNPEHIYVSSIDNDVNIIKI